MENADLIREIHGTCWYLIRENHGTCWFNQGKNMEKADLTREIYLCKMMENGDFTKDNDSQSKHR